MGRVIKQRKMIVLSKIIMLVIVLLFNGFLLTNFQEQSIYVKCGIIFLVLITVKYMFNFKNEIYSLSMDESVLIIRFYLTQKNYKVSDIEKIYRIAEHNVSFNRRYGVVKAISIFINGKRYTVSEEYDNYLLFEKYVCSKFDVCDVQDDSCIIA